MIKNWAKNTFISLRRVTSANNKYTNTKIFNLFSCGEIQIKQAISAHVLEWLKQKIVIIATKCWLRLGETGSFLHCWWEYKTVQPLWQTGSFFKNKLSYNPTIALLGVYPREMKTHVHTKSYTKQQFVALLKPWWPTAWRETSPGSLHPWPSTGSDWKMDQGWQTLPECQLF